MTTDTGDRVYFKANDNHRSEVYDDPRLEIMRQEFSDLYSAVKKKLPSVFIRDNARSVDNFLWFAAFESGWRKKVKLNKNAKK